MTLPPPCLRWSAKVSVVNAYVKHNFFGPLTRIISNNIVICSKLENTQKKLAPGANFNLLLQKYHILMFCKKLPQLTKIQGLFVQSTNELFVAWSWQARTLQPLNLEELQWGLDKVDKLDKVRFSCFFFFFHNHSLAMSVLFKSRFLRLLPTLPLLVIVAPFVWRKTSTTVCSVSSVKHR